MKCVREQRSSTGPSYGERKRYNGLLLRRKTSHSMRSRGSPVSDRKGRLFRMPKTMAIVLGLAAAVFVMAIPFTLLSIYARRGRQARAALSEWARERGLVPSRSSAILPAHAAYVSGVSFELDGGVLSIAIAESRHRAYVSFYYRPHAPRAVCDFSLHRRTWGAGGQPLGDPELDRHYLVMAADPAGVLEALCRQAREQLVAQHAEAWSLGAYQDTLLYVQVGALVDEPARDRAIHLLRTLART